MNNTQFSRLRRECFLHPHKQHPWNRWPQGQKDTLKPQQKYLSLAGGSPANFHGTFQLPSLLLDKGECFFFFVPSFMASEAKNAQAPGSTTHERSQVHSAVQWNTLSFQNAVTLDTKSQGWERPCNLSTGNWMPLCENLFCHHHILYLSDTTSTT